MFRFRRDVFITKIAKVNISIRFYLMNEWSMILRPDSFSSAHRNYWPKLY